MDYHKTIKQLHRKNGCTSCSELFQRNSTLGALIKLGMDLSGCYDEQVLLNKAMETVLSAFEGRWCVLRILDEATGELTIKASTGLSEKIKNMAMKVRPEGTLLDQVLSSGFALGIENLDTEKSKVLPYFADEIKSILVAPVKISGKSIGT